MKRENEHCPTPPPWKFTLFVIPWIFAPHHKTACETLHKNNNTSLFSSSVSCGENAKNFADLQNV